MSPIYPAKGVSQFIQLSDAPSSYVGQALKPVRVKSTVDGLEFASALTQYVIPTNITPDTLTQMWLDNTKKSGYRIMVVGKYMLSICSDGTNFKIFDISNVKAPTELQSINGFVDFAVVGRYLYLLDQGNARFACYDWLDPRNLVFMGFSSNPNMTTPLRCVARGRYLYVLSWGGAMPNTMCIFDTSNPSSAVYVGKYTSNINLGGPWDLAVQGNYAFVLNSGQFADRGWLTALNIADPTNPTFVSRVQYNAAAAPLMSRFKISGRYAYICDRQANALRVVDISNPAAMTLLWSTVDAVNLALAMDCAVVGDWIFVTGLQRPGYITILDWRVKTAAPVFWSTMSITINSNAAATITIAGKYAFVGGYDAAGPMYMGIWACWAIDVPAFVGNSIYAEYIYCDNLDVAVLADLMAAQIGGVGIPDTLPRIISVPLVLKQVVAAAPGVAYVELSALYRDNLDFSKIPLRQARVVVSAIGNEAGAGKGIQIYNNTDASEVCAVTWDGNVQQNALAGAWTTANLRAAKDLYVRVKGSSATENITVDKVELQLAFA